MQAEFFADDLYPPSGAETWWSDEQLAAFFESGGMVLPSRPTASVSSAADVGTEVGAENEPKANGGVEAKDAWRASATLYPGMITIGRASVATSPPSSSLPVAASQDGSADAELLRMATAVSRKAVEGALRILAAVEATPTVSAPETAPAPPSAPFPDTPSTTASVPRAQGLERELARSASP